MTWRGLCICPYEEDLTSARIQRDREKREEAGPDTASCLFAHSVPKIILVITSRTSGTLHFVTTGIEWPGWGTTGQAGEGDEWPGQGGACGEVVRVPWCTIGERQGTSGQARPP